MKEDDLIRDLLTSCSSYVERMDEGPTIMSLQDIIELIKKKYGDEWRNYAHCKVIVIWISKMFASDKVKEIVPDLFDLCEEYRNNGTVNGKEMVRNIDLLSFIIFDTNYKKMDFLDGLMKKTYLI